MKLKTAFVLFIVIALAVPVYASPEDLFFQANGYFWNRDYNNALRVYSEIITNHPDSEYYIQSLFSAAGCYFQMKNYDEALNMYSKVENMNDMLTDDAAYKIIQIYVNRGDNQKALDKAREFNQKYPRSILKRAVNELEKKIQAAAAAPQASASAFSAPSPAPAFPEITFQITAPSPSSQESRPAPAVQTRPRPERVSAPAPAPRTDSKKSPEYTVQPNDNLITIARVFYNDSSKFKNIAAANNIQHPYRIYAGQRLIIPQVDEERQTPAPAPSSPAPGAAQSRPVSAAVKDDYSEQLKKLKDENDTLKTAVSNLKEEIAIFEKRMEIISDPGITGDEEDLRKLIEQNSRLSRELADLRVNKVEKLQRENEELKERLSGAAPLPSASGDKDKKVIALENLNKALMSKFSETKEENRMLAEELEKLKEEPIAPGGRKIREYEEVIENQKKMLADAEKRMKSLSLLNEEVMAKYNESIEKQEELQGRLEFALQQKDAAELKHAKEAEMKTSELEERLTKSENRNKELAEQLSKVILQYASLEDRFDKIREHEIRQTRGKELMDQAVRLRKAGRNAEAEEIYKRGLSTEPDNPDLLNGLAFLYASWPKNLDKAEELINQAVKLNPREEGYYLDTLGKIKFQKRQYRLALDFFTRALNLIPSTDKYARSTVKFHIAESLDKMGMSDKAFFYLIDIIKEVPNTQLALDSRRMLERIQ